jgi:hypothetical protein
MAENMLIDVLPTKLKEWSDHVSAIEAQKNQLRTGEDEAYFALRDYWKSNDFDPNRCKAYIDEIKKHAKFHSGGWTALKLFQRICLDYYTKDKDAFAAFQQAMGGRQSAQSEPTPQPAVQQPKPQPQYQTQPQPQYQYEPQPTWEAPKRNGFVSFLFGLVCGGGALLGSVWIILLFLGGEKYSISLTGILGLLSLSIIVGTTAGKAWSNRRNLLFIFMLLIAIPGWLSLFGMVPNSLKSKYIHAKEQMQKAD